MKKQQTSEWYDHKYQKSIKSGSEYSLSPEKTAYFHVWEKVLDQIGADEWIGDFGCGVGQFAELAIKKNKKYLFGVDFSEVAINEAIRRNPTKKDYFFIADLADEIKWVAFDVAVCLEVLEHLDNDTQFLQNIPTGKHVVLSVPNYNSLSHVRYFKDAAAVKKRYKYHVEIKSITEVPVGINGPKIFIIDGNR